MTATTTKLTRSADELNSDGITKAQLLGVFGVLKKRPLLLADFVTAKEAITRMSAAMSERLFCSVQDNENSRPINRTLRFSAAYMAAYISDTYKDDILLVTDRIHLSARECLRCLRGVPVSIDTSSAEIRHIRNTANMLHYSEKDFVKAALLALPIAKVLAPFLDREKSEIPIAIPHSHGLFLGTVTQSLPLNVDYIAESWKAERKLSKGNFKMGFEVTEDYFTLGAAVRFYDSISFRLFEREHNYAYDELLPFLQSRDQLMKLRRGLEIYAWGPFEKKMVSDKDRQAWDEVCNDVRSAVGELIGHPNRRFHSIYTLPLAA